MNARTSELFESIRDKNITKLREALTYDSVDLTFKNSHNFTAIVVAARQYFWEGVLKIAEHSLDTDGKKNFGDALTTTLNADFASFSKVGDKLRVIQRLLQSQAKLNWRISDTQDGCLHVAVKKNDHDILKLLLQYNAPLDSVNLANLTPLELACQLGHTKCIDAFLDDLKVQVVCQKREGAKKLHIDQALYSTLEQDDYYVAKQLLENFNASCKASDRRGNIGLYFAIENNNAKLVSLLLKHGASIEDENCKGQTMLEFAQSRWTTSCVKVLKAALASKAALQTTTTPLSSVDCKFNEWLNNLEQDLLTRKFFVQTVFGTWVVGDPANVKEIKIILKQKKENNAESIRYAFSSILSILSYVPPSSKRNMLTSNWYKEMLEKMEAVKADTQITTMNEPPLYCMTNYGTNRGMKERATVQGNVSARGIYGSSTESQPINSIVLSPIYSPTVPSKGF